MNEAETKEAMFLLGELNTFELYTLIVGLLEAHIPPGFELMGLRHLIQRVKKLNEATP